MKHLIDKIKKHCTPQMIYWLLGLLALLPTLLWLTWRIIAGPMTRERDDWRKAFDQYKVVSIVNVPPMRGNIYATDGRPIAVAGESYMIKLDFSAKALDLIHNDSLRMPKDSVLIKKQAARLQLLEHQLDLAAQQLADFYGIDTRPDRARWSKALRAKTNGEPLINREISYPEWHKIQSRYPFVHYRGKPKTPKDDTISIFASTIMDRYSDVRYVRINPFDSLGLRTIGALHRYKQKDSVSQAKYGLELMYDSLLTGKPGLVKRIRGAGSTLNRIIDTVQHGYDLYTSLDMDKQYLLERTMYEQLSRLKAQRGTSVLMEVQTGKVLAIVNLNRNANGHYSEDGNYAFSDLSDPGSTIKIASMLVALNDGVVQPDDVVDTGNGLWPYSGKVMRDHNHHRGGFGQITASQAIERSSNIGVAKLIVRHYQGREAEFIDKMNALGFGLDLESEIPGAALAQILGPMVDGKRNPYWSALSMPWKSHGYETKIPPIYMVSFFNAIANGGRFMRPYFVTDIKDKEGHLIRHIEPRALIEQIASPDAIAKIKEMMRRVVSEQGGTGSGLRSDIVSVSGKTGTAELQDEGGPNRYLVTFCGFFPSEAPKYSIIVTIREPGPGFNPSGGALAGPVVKAIAERLVSMETPRYLPEAAPSGGKVLRHISGGRKDALSAVTRSTALPYSAQAEAGDRDFVFVGSDGAERRIAPPAAGCVPPLQGLSATDAAAWLSRLGYRASFTGYGYVVGQSVAAGTSLRRGQTVRLQLGRGKPS